MVFEPLPRPAKVWRVVPPIWKAATPVLAVIKVCSGGSTPKNVDQYSSVKIKTYNSKNCKLMAKKIYTVQTRKFQSCME